MAVEMIRIRPSYWARTKLLVLLIQLYGVWGQRIIDVQHKIISHTHAVTYLGFPLSAAWCRALKPLLLAIVMSAWYSSRSVIMSSRFLLMASCKAVSPSESYDSSSKIRLFTLFSSTDSSIHIYWLSSFVI